MTATDIRIIDAHTQFHEVVLDQPFAISGRPITHFSAAQVTLTAESRDGARAQGTGYSMLSVPWSWPRAEVDVSVRDEVLRDLVREFAQQVPSAGWGDPVQIWRQLYARLDHDLERASARAGCGPVPRLAGMLALGVVDNALHDVWGQAAGRSVYSMYTEDFLSEDLSWIGADLTGAYPGDYLSSARTELPVQHVLGGGDGIDAGQTGPETKSLAEWLSTEGIWHLKLKVEGEPEADARRVVQAYRVAAVEHGNVALSIDPNEGYHSVADLEAMLDAVGRAEPAALADLTYLEQPFPRTLTPDAQALARLSQRVPVVMDEGFTQLSQLPELREQGWTGVVIKASKGQSAAMLTYAFAKARGLDVVVQDLTHVGRSLVHSAGLVAALELSWPHLEYNSRQYAPGANADLAAELPDLARVRDGLVQVPSGGIGLY